MDKYADETPELKRRVDKYSGLYESNSSNDYDKFDVDSNVSVLKDNARSIDVDQIREMLDKKYRDNIPKRKSISVESTNVDAEVAYKNSDEKDYDLNVILDKAKQNRKVSYEEDRFNRIETSSSEKLIDEINRKYKPKEESEEAAELLNLINTITELELKNKNKDSNFEPDDNVDTPNLIAAQELAEKDDNEETFYTGKLAIKEKDYDDFRVSMGKFAIGLSKFHKLKISDKEKLRLTKVFLDLNESFEDLMQRNIIKDAYIWK